MRDMRITHTDISTSNRNSRLIAGIVLALGVIGLGVYGYEAGMFRPQSPVAYGDLPNPGLPVINR